MTRRDFARELSRAREQAGLTVREIAGVLGVPASTLGGYFGGAHLPRAVGLERILSVCGITEPAASRRWRDALGQARRAITWSPAGAPGTAPLPGGGGPPPPRPAYPDPSGPGELAALSTRAPVHRLAGEPHLRGRDALLDLLTVALRADRAVRARVHVLHGLGGCGKTSVALALAERAMAAGVRTWWVNAENPASAGGGMRAVAVELGARPVRLRLGSGPDQLWRQLERRNDPWLLVVDNADDPVRTLAMPGGRIVDGTGWLRPISAGPGLIVVTSRDGGSTSWGPTGSRWLRLHHIRPLPDQDGALVLRELAGAAAGRLDAAQRLSHRLGGLPLALRQAGRYLAETARIPAGLCDPTEPRTFDDYRHRLEQGRPGELFRLTGDNTAGDNTAGDDTGDGRSRLATTWERSLDLLERDGMRQARPLLRLLASFAAGPIPYALLLRRDVLDDASLWGRLTGRGLYAVLLALADVGLIELNQADPEGVAATHTLVVAAVVRDAARAEVAAQLPRYLRAVTDLLTAAVRDLDPDEPESWARWQALARHCGSALDLVREHRLGPADTPPEVLTPAARAADYLRAAGHPGRAASRYLGLIATARRLFGPDHPDVLALRHELSRSWYDAGCYNRAKRGLHEVLAVRRASLGADHPATLATAHVLAQALRDHGQLPEAYQRFTDVHARRARVLGPADPDTLATAAALAETCRLRGRLEEAERWLRRVEAAARTVLPPGHPGRRARPAGRPQWSRLAG